MKYSKHTFTALLLMLSDSGERARIVDTLFPDVHEDYRAEWFARDPQHFWMALDEGNQCRVMEMAELKAIDWGYPTT